jgi:hypothetical protein
MTATPAETPVMIPEVGRTDAIVGLPLDHVPPNTEFANVVVPPTQTVSKPVIDAGKASTLTIAVVGPQPLLYEIVVKPAESPVTTPEAEIIAMPGIALFQVPPGKVLVRVRVLPTQKGAIPVIGAGNADTVTNFDTKQPKELV